MYYKKPTSSSIFDAFSLNPMPYPVLLLLAVISILLGLQWYVSYESAVEAAEEGMGWLLMVAPLVLLIAVRWLSASDPPCWWLYAPWDRRRREYYLGAVAGDGGGSPWVVAALIVLLLVFVQFQSAFLEGWFI
ncbi:Unknown protein [Striga hermonthica]|uniref:Uncharacterized protein n=1 Tax=Striga hermonthica TaxID=68872 RepID=A0A9N7ME94_STRHE|nr:Unknown protein [Striga hermonthica]